MWNSLYNNKNNIFHHIWVATRSENKANTPVVNALEEMLATKNHKQILVDESIIKMEHLCRYLRAHELTEGGQK